MTRRPSIPMKAAEIRRRFLEYFASNGHTIVPSASLVPANDPTLLFTNSGMVQFKDVFLGTDKRPYVRAADVQRCLRAGGKHNDLENVGYTARHHTFFEMLGNWSFGDYFKRDAIRYAWDLLTGVYGLDPSRLWVTVYQTDDEAYGVWADDIGVPRERIVRIGDNKGAPYASDNFWQMADTGPCGPCSEIFFDHGPGIAGGPPGSADAEGDRYIEIWNLVFMQFDRDANGVLTPLPKPCVDTGMGLERLAAVLQHVHSNYEIDLFRDLIGHAARVTATKDLASPSLRVIADHIRACAFLVVDGVIPGNEGRGYVLRRIIRRAIRHGYQLGQTQPFFHKLVPELSKLMGEAYPELPQKQDHVIQVLAAEEARFAETLVNGMKVLEAALGEATKAGLRVLPGETAFTLYDTFGFPLDLTADVCRERGFGVDQAGFDAAMDKQRAAGTRGVDVQVGGRPRLPRRQDRVRRLRNAGRRRARRVALSRRQRGRVARERRGGHRRARPHAVLRRVGRTGGGPRRAFEERDVPDAVRGDRHAEDPARCVRTSRHGQDRRASRRRHRRRARRRRARASAPRATTRRRT